MCHAVSIARADAAAASRVDEAVLRARIEKIFSVHKLRVEHHIALLVALGDEVRQPLPLDEVLCAYDAACCRCGGSVSLWRGLVLRLGAEESVDPAVLVLCKAHVVHVCV